MANIKMVKLGKKGQIVIPKVLRDKVGIGSGDLLLLSVEGDRISIIPPEKYAKMTRGLLKGLWGNTPDEVKSYIETAEIMGIINDFRRMLLQCRCVFLDTAPLIYHLEDIEPYSTLTAEISSALASGSLKGVISLNDR